MTIPPYIGANLAEANRVRARVGQPAPEVVRSAARLGRGFRSYWRAVWPSLVGLGLFIIVVGTAAGWIAVVTR